MLGCKQKVLTLSSMLKCISVPRVTNEALEELFVAALEPSIVIFIRRRIKGTTEKDMHH
jgi:hypothetical protein